MLHSVTNKDRYVYDLHFLIHYWFTEKGTWLSYFPNGLGSVTWKFL